MSDDFDEDDSGPSGDENMEGVSLRRCHECKGETIGEQCGVCGNELCPMCFECGAGFCSAFHTQEQIWAYEDALMGPPTTETLRHRQAHREQVAAGILPSAYRLWAESKGTNRT